MKTILFTAALILLPALALADEASDHAGKAVRAYNLQDWPTALKEFKLAYDLDPKPETLWSIAQVQRLSGDCRSAIFTYKAYMRTAPAAGANAAQEHVSKCEAALAEQRKTVEQTTAPAPASKPEPSPPPAASAPPAKEEPKKQPGPWALDPLGDVVFVAGLGALATGIVFLAIGSADMSAAPKKPTYQQYDASVGSARTEQYVGVTATIAGGVFLGLAVWRFAAVASSRAKEKEERAAVVLVPAPGGAFGSYTLRF